MQIHTGHSQSTEDRVAQRLGALDLETTFATLTAPLAAYRDRWDARHCLNVHVWGDFRGRLDSVEGHAKKTYDIHEEFKDGTLYRFELPECDYFMFVHSDFETHGRRIAAGVTSLYKLNGFIWFSYMRGGCEFRWHKDNVQGRLHYPLRNSGRTAAIEDIEGRQYFMPPGRAYTFEPKITHRVPPQHDERLHLVCSICEGPA